MNELFAKYDVPAPRYTSYPTVPFWSNTPTTEQWLEALDTGLNEEATTWSIYLHLPFCETLCTFCACNTVITRDHGREDVYVDLLLKEWALYHERLPQLRTRPLQQLHLGGGSPTFFSPANLRRILEPMLANSARDEAQFDASIEVDPRRTTREQMAALRELGFTRVSLGVQDFDAEVQRLVNRIQPFDQTKRVTDEARELGYTSVNYDLIYGLPRQTPASFEATAQQTVDLRPDRIALYSFALVPWIKPTQRSYKTRICRKAGEKRALYELARELLLGAGYIEIGMDHFALPQDPLALAQADGTLHRNFMGYTEARTRVMLGLGVSSISGDANLLSSKRKSFPGLRTARAARRNPDPAGHLLDAEDRNCASRFSNS
jgi:oxygen-independent coproporphyrinogen-3 oxidase